MEPPERFLEVFDLKDLESLPKLKEIRELGTYESTQEGQENRSLFQDHETRQQGTEHPQPEADDPGEQEQGD